MVTYEEFIARKRIEAQPVGFEPREISSKLFPFQRDITRWALRRGRAALFAECGLGKGWMALEWAREVHEFTGRPVIIFAPLAVSQQFAREAIKLWGAPSVTVCKSQADVKPGINVANYERFDKFDPREFGGIVADESSILKNSTGKMRTALIEFASVIPYRLACTATPAPNDHEELGNHTEFLGIMQRTEMLATWFVHDGGDTQSWRLKGHAETSFWQWVCTWAVALTSPADLGYDSAGYNLPPLSIAEHVVDVDHTIARAAGQLFSFEAKTLSEQRSARKSSLEDRVQRAAELVAAEPNEHWIVWTDLNEESSAVAKAIPGAVEVVGSDDTEFKQNAILWFTGDICACQLRAKKNTKENGTSGTENTSKPTAQPIETSETKHGASSTLTTHRTEAPLSVRSLGSTKKTQEQGSLRDSGCTESHPTTTSESSPSKEAAAQSAGRQNQKTSSRKRKARQENEDCTLTTIIEPETSEDSSVRHATSVSANSQTTPSASTERPCTCDRNQRRVIVSKGSIFGFGVNLQHCARAVFVGLSHSFEQWHQANRRVWRFGQTRPVSAHVITSSAEGRVVENIKRKQADAHKMISGMVANMKDITRADLKSAGRELDGYAPTINMRVPSWLRSEENAA
jgi:hypothetical protein